MQGLAQYTITLTFQVVISQTTSFSPLTWDGQCSSMLNTQTLCRSSGFFHYAALFSLAFRSTNSIRFGLINFSALSSQATIPIPLSDFPSIAWKITQRLPNPWKQSWGSLCYLAWHSVFVNACFLFLFFFLILFIFLIESQWDMQFKDVHYWVSVILLLQHTSIH